MSIFNNFIRKVFEKKPELLENFDQNIIKINSIEAFKNEQIYYFEQLNKYIPVEFYIDSAEVERFMYNALAECRIDEFCFLLNLLKKRRIKISFDESRIQDSYNILAKRGNITGLETVIKKTDIIPKLKKENVLKSYNSLIASGRIEAIDYIRQLSDIPVKFSYNAINLGFEYLLLSNKYEIIEKMIEITGMNPKFNNSLLIKSINCEIDDLNFKVVYIILKYLGEEHLVNSCEFNINLNKLLNNLIYEQIPYLFALYPKENICILDEEILDKVLNVCDLWSIKFLYSQPNLMEFKLRNIDFVSKIAFQNNDSDLIIKISEITKKKILPLQCTSFFKKALIETNIKQVINLIKCTEGLPEFKNEILQLFLYKLILLKKTKKYKNFTETFKCANYDIGQFVYAVETADIKMICQLYEKNHIVQNQLIWANNIYQIAKELKKYYE